MAATFSTLASSASAEPTTASAATLSWRVSEQAWTASSLAPTRGADAPATFNPDPTTGTWTFGGGTGSYDPDTGATSLAFSGAITFGNTVQGDYGFKFANPVFTVGADGVGTLNVGLSTRGPGGSTFGTVIPDVTVATFTVSNPTVTDGHVSLTINPDFILRTDLTPEANPNGFRQFPQSLVGNLSGAFLGHFRQTAVNQPLKAPAPINLEFDFVEPGPGADQQSIEATIPEPEPAGEFSWTIDAENHAVVLSEATNQGSYLQSTGELKPVTVSDTRAGSPAWSVSGQVGDFTGGLSGKYLGWTPKVTAAGAGATAGPQVDPGIESGNGLKDSSVLASAAVGHPKGTGSFGADLDLRVPAATPAGTYTATLTLTALS